MAVGTSAGELRELTNEELTDKLRESKENCSTCASRWPPVSWTTTAGCGRSGTIARIYTVLNERELGLASGPD